MTNNTDTDGSLQDNVKEVSQRVLGEAVERPLRSALTIVVIVLLVGTLFYHVVEGWDLLDSLYFCVITLTTIGYGDFSPRTDLGKLFTIFFAFAGIGVLASYLNLRAQRAVQRQDSHGVYRKKKAGNAAPQPPEEKP